LFTLIDVALKPDPIELMTSGQVEVVESSTQTCAVSCALTVVVPALPVATTTFTTHKSHGAGVIKFAEPCFGGES
jgi:hypothetical protein